MIVYLLALTIFSLTTAEFMIAGMMPALANALQVSTGKIGYLISLYALGMALGGPLLTALLLGLRVSHKLGLLWLLVLYIAGAVVAAAATNYEIMAFGRVLMGVASAACFGLSMTICASLVVPEARGRAASFVLGGLMLAPAMGVPGTTLLEQAFGWRASFWAVAVLAMFCTVAVAWCVPRTKEQRGLGLAAEVRAIWNLPLLAAYTTSALIIGGTFAAVSYFSPILTEVSGFPTTAMPQLLAIYGLANLVGNTIVGRLADRYTMEVLAGGLAILGCALTAFALFAQEPSVSVTALIAIGLTGVALNPAMVVRVMRTAEPGPLVNTMHASFITGGLAVGTWLGGLAVDRGYGVRSPLWVGAVLALAALLSLVPIALGNLSRFRRVT